MDPSYHLKIQCQENQTQRREYLVPNQPKTIHSMSSNQDVTFRKSFLIYSIWWKPQKEITTTFQAVKNSQASKARWQFYDISIYI